MSLKVYVKDNKVILEYSPVNGTEWIVKEFKNKNKIVVKRTFHLSEKDLITTDDDFAGEYTKQFIIGNLEGHYYRIYKQILFMDYDVLFHETCDVNINCFIVDSNISILLKFVKLAKQQIIIGGDGTDSIPEVDFKKILKSFPTRTELKHYSNSRITNVISQYLKGVEDSGKAFEKYLENRDKIPYISSIPSINKYEYEKYSFILSTLKNMLQRSEYYREGDWQKQILEIILVLYPKYIRCFSEVRIKDYYTNIGRSTNRFIDLMLVDTNGNIDVIEIKKPFDNCVISSRTYRDNYTPMKELSGTIMQVEKYLFHLNKWGVKGEKELTQKYQSELPNTISIRITNPKGIAIMGRDNNINKQQIFDLEIIKRKYTNVIDIITYDNLIKRLENIIGKFV